MRQKAGESNQPGATGKRPAPRGNGHQRPEGQRRKNENRKTRYAEHTERIRSQNVISGNFRF